MPTGEIRILGMSPTAGRSLNAAKQETLVLAMIGSVNLRGAFPRRMRGMRTKGQTGEEC
jgi:hypothetical protein